MAEYRVAWQNTQDATTPELNQEFELGGHRPATYLMAVNKLGRYA
jgi:hypothetical protein